MIPVELSGFNTSFRRCLFREYRSNSHCSEVCFSVLVADTIPTSDFIRATGATFTGVIGKGLNHGRK